MIRSYQDYLYYLECDRLSLEQTRKRPRLFRDEEWRYQRALRRVEYLQNCKHGPFGGLLLVMAKFHLHRLSVMTGFHIPLNVFGPGLSLAHYGSTTGANTGSRIGANCRIQAGVMIGTEAGAQDHAPLIGNNVYIGPGAKIFGPIRIADGIAIGANAVVNKSFEEPNITIGGIPAKKISDKGSEGLMIRGCGDEERMKEWAIP